MLAKGTHQMLFDTVFNGIRAQGFKRSVDRLGNCMYRSTDGNSKCAAGHLIPNELYSKEFEGYSFLNHNMFQDLSSETLNPLVEYLKTEYSVTDEEFKYLLDRIQKLQHIHDTSYFTQVMREKLEEYATENELTVPR